MLADSKPDRAFALSAEVGVRNFGIHNVRAGLGGGEHQLARSRDNYAPREYFTTERVNPDDYELGGFLTFAGVIGCPVIIVLGLVEAYKIVSLWFGLPSFPAQ